MNPLTYYEYFPQSDIMIISEYDKTSERYTKLFELERFFEGIDDSHMFLNNLFGPTTDVQSIRNQDILIVGLTIDDKFYVYFSEKTKDKKIIINCR